MFYRFGLPGVQGDSTEADAIEGFDHGIDAAGHRRGGAAGGQLPLGLGGELALGLTATPHDLQPPQQLLETFVKVDPRSSCPFIRLFAPPLPRATAKQPADQPGDARGHEQCDQQHQHRGRPPGYVRPKAEPLAQRGETLAARPRRW